MDLAEMCEKFSKSINCLLINKRVGNESFLRVEKYDKQLKEVRISKTVLNTAVLKKIPKDLKEVLKYDVITISGIDRLNKIVQNNSSNIHYYLINESLFDIQYLPYFYWSL